MERWIPVDTGANYTLSPLLQPLKELQNDFLLLSNLGNPAAVPGGPGDHACGVAATLSVHHPHKTEGSDIEGAISIDQLIAQGWGKATRYPSLELASIQALDVQTSETGWNGTYARHIAWSGPTQPLPQELNARNAFDRLFTTSSGGGRRYPRGSVLDAVRDQANRLRQRLGATDKAKVDEYLTSLREVETNIGNTTMVNPGDTISDDRSDFQGQVRSMLDILTLAFQTDSTRVATYMIGEGGACTIHDFLGITDAHHYLSHHGGDPDKLEKLATINTWEVQQLAYLLGKLKAIPEGDGTLLDHSVVLFTSEVGDGNAHSHTSLPVLVAGRGNGGLSPGRHLHYDDNPPLESLHAAILQTVGFPQATLDGRSVTPLAQLQG